LPAKNSRKKELLARIRSAEAGIGIVGMGYVGLPLAMAFAEKGFPVLGFDVDQSKVSALGKGQSYIAHLDAERVRALARSGKLRATSDFARLQENDVIVVCVPTPLTPQREPDMSYIVKTAEQIRDRLRSGQLVVLESTTYPGTTEELVRPLLEQSGLGCGRDFFLAFSPEREDPGNPRYATTTIPKVVGGVDRDSGDLAEALYACIMNATVRVSSARAAEASKLTENIFRAVNIALVNELKIIYQNMGIDVWEVLDAASTKPFGFMRFDPGPGWGGHCIPVDPFYLSWKAREHGVDTKFIELAGEINRRMPEYVLERLREGLNRQGKPVKGSRVLVLGLAYKRGVGDTRESPSIQIIPRLMAMGARVAYHDPFVPVLPQTRAWPEHPRMASRPLSARILSAQDAVLIITDHPGVDYDLVARNARLIVDTRGIFRQKRSNLVKA